MHLIHEIDARMILVGACIEGWQFDTPTLSIMASVPTSGDWPNSVEIRCSASEDDPLRLDGPILKGWGQVPLEELVSALRATVEEREKVLAAMKMGIPGPFMFEQSVWETVRLFGGA